MTQQDIINTIADSIGNNAYKSRIHHEIAQLGHEEDRMYYRAGIEMGKSSGCLECLIYLTGEYYTIIHREAYRRAECAISRANGNIPMLLKLVDEHESEDYHQLINDH